MGLNALLWFDVVERYEAGEFFEWFFNLSRELALGATFSSMLLMAIGVMAFLNGLVLPTSRLWKRGYWFLLGVVFVFLGLDEYYVIHETIQQAIGNWQLIYGVGGIVVMGLSVVAYWYGFRDDSDFFLILFVGFLLTGISAILLDFVTQEIICLRTSLGIGCNRFFVIEEYLEMAGATIILASIVSYANQKVTVWRWKRSVQVLMGVTGLYGLWLVGNLWILPSIEARTSATAVDVHYGDDEMSLVGYRLSQELVEPGDRILITLYWRPNRWLRREYIQSIHALERPTFRSIAQYDTPRNDRYPTDAWIPGLVVREVLPLTLPGESDIPASYPLSLEFWHRDERLVVIDSDHSQLNESTILLDQVTVYSGTPDLEPTVDVSYRFGSALLFSGYDLPDAGNAGDAIDVSFWWEAVEDVRTQLTQFVHLFHVTSETFYTFDRRPFADRFPTENWRAGLQMLDHWEIELPLDIPTGEYHVHTGLYDSNTIERKSVFDVSGGLVQDSSIPLGIIRVQAEVN